MTRASAGNDTACEVHGISMILQEFSFFAYHVRFEYDFHFSKLFENFVLHAGTLTYKDKDRTKLIQIRNSYEAHLPRKNYLKGQSHEKVGEIRV
jgi:hypothetical protein